MWNRHLTWVNPRRSIVKKNGMDRSHPNLDGKIPTLSSLSSFSFIHNSITLWQEKLENTVYVIQFLSKNFQDWRVSDFKISRISLKPGFRDWNLLYQLECQDQIIYIFILTWVNPWRSIVRWESGLTCLIHIFPGNFLEFYPGLESTKNIFFAFVSILNTSRRFFLNTLFVLSTWNTVHYIFQNTRTTPQEKCIWLKITKLKYPYFFLILNFSKIYLQDWSVAQNVAPLVLWYTYISNHIYSASLTYGGATSWANRFSLR